VVEGVFMRLGEIGDEFAVVPDQFVADGDTVVALGHLSWLHKGSRAPATVQMAPVLTFEGGKAVAFQQHVDTVRVRELS
jgi:ketosteroid isomerase-like protein